MRSCAMDWHTEEMTAFKHIDDVVVWLEPMDYETFWDEIRPWCLVILPRATCDADIAAGKVGEAEALAVLKTMARLELSRLLKLKWAETLEPMALH